MIEFRIIDEPDQQFATIMNRRRVTIRLRYNVTNDRWSLNLSIDDVPVIRGRRIVTGVDMLRSHPLGLGVMFALPVTPGAVPDRESLVNGNVRLYQASQGEVDAAISA